MKKKTIISLLIISLLGAGIFYLPFKKNKNNLDKTAPIATFFLEEANIQKTIFGDAVVKSSDTYLIYSKLNSTMKDIYKRKGDVVAVGDVLAVMDVSHLEKTLKQATYQLQLDLDAYKDIQTAGNSVSQSNYANALTTYNSNSDIYNTSLRLFNEGIISKTELNSVKANMDSSYSSYLSALNNLNTTSSVNELYKYELKLEIDRLEVDAIKREIKAATLTAPISGTITSTVENLDKVMTTGEVLFEIQNLQSLQVVSNISEYEINDITVGQKTLITSLGIYDKTYHGVIRSVAPSADLHGSEVLIEVVIDIEDEDHRLKPNFTTNIEILIDSKSNVLVVPYEAITTKDKQSFVTKMVEGNPVIVPVKRGLESELYIEVISKDLSVGDEILMNNSDLLLSEKDIEMKGLNKMKTKKSPVGDKQ